MNEQIETRIKERLDEIKAIPARDPKAAARGRATFLSQAVSASESRRHRGWNSIFRKEQFAMNAILSILVLAGLLFGGGATVSAAQDDLPNQPLYAVKTWSEDLSLQFQNNQEEKVNRLMELAQTRVQEMAKLNELGEPVPDQVRLRLEQHIQQALQTCTTMDDATLDRTLLQLRDRLQQQDRDMERLQLHTQSQDTLQLLTQTRTMLRERLRLVEDGLLNHEMFRYRIQTGFRYGQDEELTPPAQNQNQNGPQNGQPILPPGGPNTQPGGPNLEPGGPRTGPGEPNAAPGGPNTSPGGPNPDAGGNNNDSGSGANNNDGGGSGSGGGSSGGSGGPNDNGSGGNKN
ncbi:MAG: hypothetical protein FIB03_19330 [Anaerolineae bacterium]|nr:hypothetical protein [Anaerolineae bacterium]